MSGIFGSDTPSGGQTQAQARADELSNAERDRSERQRLDTIQQQLRLETSSRSRGYGLTSLLGSLGSGRRSLLGAG